MKTAILYCRKSTESEERQVQSIDDQIAWWKQYAKLFWLEIIEIIQESKTAKQPWREEFNRMIKLFAESKKNKPKAIISWKLDRLSRNPIDEWTIKWACQNNWIEEIHTVDWVVTGQNILLMSVHFWMANQYIVDLKKNVERWMMSKLAKWWLIWSVPFWYKVNLKTHEAEIDEKNSEFVKMIFEMRNKNISYTEIWKKLFLLWLKSKTWKPLSHSTVEQITSNPFYIWLMKFRWELHRWKYNTFIDSDLYNSVNSNKQWYTPRNRLSFEFKWYIKNNHNEKILVAYEKKWNIYYSSHWSEKDYKVAINEKKLVELFGDYISQYSIKWEIQKACKKWIKDYYIDIQKEIKKKYNAIKQKDIELDERKNRLFELLLKWTIDDENYKKEINDIQLSKITIKKELEEIEQSDLMIMEDLVKFVELLSDIDTKRKNADYNKKLEIIKNIVVELKIDIEKRLYIQENELFEIVRWLNGLEWHPH